MAPVLRLRSLAWIKARRLPGVRCSTLKTECRSLLCLMIIPGRIWVAGIDIAGNNLLQNNCDLLSWRKAGQATFSAAQRPENLFYTQAAGKETFPKLHSS